VEIKLHRNATTTPAVRTIIQRSSAPTAELARRFGVNQTTVRRWRNRAGEVLDRSHARHHRGQSTDPTSEALISELRTTLGLSLDDIVEVMRRCLDPNLSRSAIFRCLQRLGLSRRPAPKAAAPGRFAAEPCGFIHLDLKHLTRLRGDRTYAYVAIDRATRFVYLEIHARRDAATARAFLERFARVFPAPIRVVLTDNGSEFTDRFAVDMKNKPEGRPSGRHPFDQACHTLHAEHRLAKPFRPQTNGMVERFNRRLAEALRARENVHPRRKFDTHQQRNAFILRFVDDYNCTRLRCLAYQAPAQALANHAEHNTKAGGPGKPLEPCGPGFPPSRE
jgi:transposase-like protein